MEVKSVSMPSNTKTMNQELIIINNGVFYLFINFIHFNNYFWSLTMNTSQKKA